MEEKVKKAAQFKSGSSSDSRGGLVCKYQLKGSTSQFIFLRVDQETGALQVDYSLSFTTSSRLEILSSCNGLLLLSQAKKRQLKYLVFDPVSNICIALPPSPYMNRKILRSGLASNGNDFHVVLCAPHQHPPCRFLELQVFSSSSGKWTTCCLTNLSLPLSLIPSRMKSPNMLVSSLTSKVFRLGHKTSDSEAVTATIFSNGAIHWTISGHLLVYHVKSNDCEVIELPFTEGGSQESIRDHHHCLWESDGRVKVSYTDESGIHTWHLLNDQDYDAYLGFNIYDGNKFRWRLEATVSQDQLRRSEAECCRTFSQWRRASDMSPITCLEAGQLMYLQIPGGIMSYKADNHALELVCNLCLPGNNKMRQGSYSFFPFMYAGLSSKDGAVDAAPAAVSLPVEDLANHVYF